MEAHMKRVIVELRVPSGFAVGRSLTMTDVQLPGFTLDPSYTPVPMAPPQNLARSLEATNEEVVIVRGEVDEQQEEALRQEPNVVAVWSDARIEPFVEMTAVEMVPKVTPLDEEVITDNGFDGELRAESVLPLLTNGAMPAFDLGTAAPCATTDCASSTAKGAIADVAKYLGCDRMWSKGIRGQGVVVGICDSGVNKAKVPAVIGGWSPTAGYTPGSAPVSSHGTMCAFDVMGMAPEAKILDIAILQSTGDIAGFLSDALAGYHWALTEYKNKGAPQILTNSWGMYQKAWAPDYATDANHPFTRKVVEAINAGMIVTFAAGNCGSQCPSGKCGTDNGPGKSIWGANGHAQVITVGAANILEQWIGYTSQGPAALCNDKPDFCAPSHFQGNTSCDNGTSAATPIAAGVIALLKSHDAKLTQAKVKEALCETSKDLCTAGWDAHSGFGMIQGYDAYRHLFEAPVKLAHAMWTHGSNVEVENSGGIAAMKRTGFCGAFAGKPGTGNWFHFAVPTPVIVEGKRLRLDSIIVMFQTDPDVTVTNIHIYDGPQKIESYDGLALSGSHLFERFDVLNTYARYGIGITVGVNFGKDTTKPHVVKFVAAGADFMN
jgi:subtilisin family serine protease